MTEDQEGGSADGDDEHEAERAGPLAEDAPDDVGRGVDPEERADRRQDGDEQEPQRAHRL